MANLSVKIKELDFKNPVMTASGTSGFAEELNDFYDISKIGQFYLKELPLKTVMEMHTPEWLKPLQGC
jgi:dihydroorotate dehydrogenase (NAD+) catalytic subunit